MSTTESLYTDIYNASGLLPKGWVWAHLGVVCKEIYRYPQFYGMDHLETGVPVIRGEHINKDGSICDDPREFWYVSEKVSSNFPKTIVENGDIVMSVRGSIGKIGIINCNLKNAQVSPNCLRISTSRNVCEPRYLFYYLRSAAFQALIQENTNATTIQTIKAGRLVKLPLPLAPLAEQRRIVAAIETELTRLDAGVASLRAAQAKLRRYRASVLKAACEGRLVEQDPSDEPASALLQRILAERRERWAADLRAKGKDLAKAHYEEPVGPDVAGLPELPAGWVWTSVDQLSIVVRGASPRPAGDPRYFGGNIPWITVGCLTADDSTPYLTSVMDFVTEAGKAASRYIEPDTLLLTNSGATLGVPKITLIGGCINDGSVALLHVDYPLKLYLYYFLASITANLRNINQGAAQPNLNTGIVKGIVVPLPPHAEQRRIVAEVERRFSVVAAMEAAVAANLKRAERLRQAILKRAFEGKLVPQDPSDEPASVLLERIRAARQQDGGAGPASNGRRGRPRKVEGAAQASPEVPPKGNGRRGRPRKVEGVAQALTEAAPERNGRRGRPRKDAARPTGRPMPASEPVHEAEQLRIDGME